MVVDGVKVVVKWIFSLLVNDDMELLNEVFSVDGLWVLDDRWIHTKNEYIVVCGNIYTVQIGGTIFTRDDSKTAEVQSEDRDKVTAYPVRIVFGWFGSVCRCGITLRGSGIWCLRLRMSLVWQKRWSWPTTDRDLLLMVDYCNFIWSY